MPNLTEALTEDVDTVVVDVDELAFPRTLTSTLAPIVTTPATTYGKIALRGASMMPHRSRTLIPIVRIELDEIEEVRS